MKNFKKIIPYIIIIIVVVLIRSFLITPAIVNGPSMKSTLYDNEIVLVNKIALKKGINRFDIVVIKYEKELIIKRVMGMPGETIKYKDNILYINGKEVKTPMNFEETKDFEYLDIKEDNYFVMGDNRDISKDSRNIGEISKENIIGKVNLVLFPFKRFGKVE